ncbi:flippase-like domain-containing protein [Halocatena salina]|uniref:Flippase-like domain-containing protein n=1 Tax=Halocatena salina TaxID=2934340 RepID=A0A8T9ZZG9_9EURY|nr:flippase-like domain-containing protein [Halocatena salina]UPM42190.1 flippase-like domain-containing protein [Halocatena salina]
MSVEVSVVLPAYNEESRIERTVQTTLDTLASFLPEGSYEVIVAEDGCDDATPEIATRIAEETDAVRHVHSDSRLGRGRALEYAFRRSEGETLVYFDTDLATDMSHLRELIESVRSGEYDVATGSRWIPGSVADRPIKRSFPSRGFNWLVRQLLGSELRDHQCGFKAFDRTALLSVLDAVEDEHWFWDTEVLVHAQRQGYRVKEFAVDWEPVEDTKVDLVRDLLGMGSQILRCWWTFTVQPRITRGVTIAGGALLVIVAIALMSVYIDPRAVIDEIQRANPWYLAGGAVVYLLSWPLRGMRYRDILREQGYTENTWFLTGAVFISQTGNLVIPARIGDAVRAYVVKMRRGIPYASGFASLAVERVFDLLTITVLSTVVFLGLAVSNVDVWQLGSVSQTGSESGRTALIVALGVGVAAILATFAIILSARSDRNYVRSAITAVSSDTYADYVASAVERFAGDIQTVTSSPAAFVQVAASSIAIWTLDVVTALFVFAAFDIDLALMTFISVGFFAVSVGNLAKVLPLSPNGVGLYEGAFSIIVVVFTPVAGPTAAAAAMVDHAIKNIMTVVGGIVSTLVLNVSLTTAVKESRDIQPSETD